MIDIRYRRDIISNFGKQRIKDESATNIVEQVTAAVETIYFEVGDIKTQEKEKNDLISVIIDRITKYFDFMSLDDIKLCFQMGIDGIFKIQPNVFQGKAAISIMMLMEWMNSYKNYRRDELFHVNKNQVIERAVPENNSKSEKEFISSLLDQLKKYLDGITIKWVGQQEMVWDMLHSKKIISVTEKEMTRHWKTAKHKAIYSPVQGARKNNQKVGTSNDLVDKLPLNGNIPDENKVFHRIAVNNLKADMLNIIFAREGTVIIKKLEEEISL